MSKYKVGAYIRLSKEEYNDERESNSVINQKQLISEYIRKNDNLELIDYYIDDGYSGTNFNRPAFKELTIRKGKNQTYYYCSSYIRNKECTSHSINKIKLEELVKQEISKKNKIENLNRSLIFDMIENIYIKENKEIEIKFRERN